MKSALIALLLAAGAAAAPVRVEPGEFRWNRFFVNRAPTAVDCRYRVVQGKPTVHMEIMSRAEFREFTHRHEYDTLALTQDGDAGEIRRVVDDHGEFEVVVINDDHAPPAMVELEVRTDVNPSADSMAQVLPPGRRLAVILISFGIFFVTITWSAWRLLRATGRPQRRALSSPWESFPRDR
jgi:hypothetical protein